jgi:hypothetical protein
MLLVCVFVHTFQMFPYPGGSFVHKTTGIQVEEGEFNPILEKQVNK